MVYRKNVDGLITAYAGLPEELRDKYALVVVGRLGLEDARGPFAEHAHALGISDRVVFTGHVENGELVLLPLLGDVAVGLPVTIRVRPAGDRGAGLLRARDRRPQLVAG
jgi:glycosyltransferase involved in cell wall biosynthesis